MIHPYAVAAFLLAIFPLIATPGASLTLLIQHVTTGGRRQALPVLLGTVSGLYAHAALAIAGLSALVMHSSQAFAAVRLLGAAYLVGLGLWTWYSTTLPPSPTRQPKRPGSVYTQALLANVLNPKAASIYLTLVPQFLQPGDPLGGQILALATAHALVMAVWLLTWTILLHRGAHLVRKARFKRAIGKVTAVALVSLGVRAATT
ncbi:Putative threonine efflux protein [[Actinomadura] parvosata subsp. kistnae]|uniref:Homoserine lactone transporter n=1 Tax=[Actinomadura] parvosata subsp. kistnae TaxID=1909395 RepID=A0A1U9ZZC6_9ACTN|nr:LysE family translocator [Nonomuraea sp. ATCC 55076]AQZ63313.1 homoserine lactone transporter [Nonomuraea sp. ATCC 55076]SPL99009.1 Putative threonine efflux protein [Actinomadura parvosata subsp. kistnae]